MSDNHSESSWFLLWCQELWSFIGISNRQLPIIIASMYLPTQNIRLFLWKWEEMVIMFYSIPTFRHRSGDLVLTFILKAFRNSLSSTVSPLFRMHSEIHMHRHPKWHMAGIGCSISASKTRFWQLHLLCRKTMIFWDETFSFQATSQIYTPRLWVFCQRDIFWQSLLI